MSAASELINPPIIELSLGVQFSPLVKLSSGHYGWFWKTELESEWMTPSDANLLDDQFEWFDREPVRLPGPLLRIEPARFPSRFLLTHRDNDNDRLLQIQPTRLHLNWRKRAGLYPSYRRLIGEFEAMLAKFEAFATATGVGAVLPNQWELTYVDAFPQGIYWDRLDEWCQVLPGLLASPGVGADLALEYSASEWTYEIPPARGRLHVSVRLGHLPGEDQPALIFQTTARGPIDPKNGTTLRTGLDLGHDVALQAFFAVTSKRTQAKWGTPS